MEYTLREKYFLIYNEYKQWSALEQEGSVHTCQCWGNGNNIGNCN